MIVVKNWGRKIRVLLAVFSMLFATMIMSLGRPTQALVSDFVDFNGISDLVNLFTDDGSPQFTNSSTGGIGNSGAINVPSGSSDVWTTKQGYSVSGAGDIYRFSAFFRVSANSGRGGLGFTASPNNTANLYATPLTGLGVTFHGGGGEFINNQTTSILSWPPDLTYSPPTWYYMVLEVTAEGASTYDMKFQIWNTDGAGELTTMKTEKLLNDVLNYDVGNASIIYGYFSADGQRMDKIDNFKIELEGSAGFVESGAPVVLTGDVSSIAATGATVAGNVTDDQGEAISARGICYATTTTPDLSDSCTTTGTGTGTFSANLTGLSPSTTYYARAYATNTQGTTYGSQVTFDTLAGPADDGDGISSVVENAAPNEGDANNDGTLDSEQANVTSLVNSLTGQYSVLEVDVECSIQSIAMSSEATESIDSDYDYPAGLMDFVVDCGTNGFTANIVQYYYGVDGNMTMRKYKPGVGYFNINSATVSDLIIGGRSAKRVSYQVQDGGSLDIDGSINGSIRDPAGLGRANTNLAGTGSSYSGFVLLGFTLMFLPVVFVVNRN